MRVFHFPYSWWIILRREKNKNILMLDDDVTITDCYYYLRWKIGLDSHQFCFFFTYSIWEPLTPLLTCTLRHNRPTYRVLRNFQTLWNSRQQCRNNGAPFCSGRDTVFYELCDSHEHHCGLRWDFQSIPTISISRHFWHFKSERMLDEIKRPKPNSLHHQI